MLGYGVSIIIRTPSVILNEGGAHPGLENPEHADTTVAALTPSWCARSTASSTSAVRDLGWRPRRVAGGSRHYPPPSRPPDERSAAPAPPPAIPGCRARRAGSGSPSVSAALAPSGCTASTACTAPSGGCFSSALCTETASGRAHSSAWNSHAAKHVNSHAAKHAHPPEPKGGLSTQRLIRLPVR